MRSHAKSVRSKWEFIPKLWGVIEIMPKELGANGKSCQQ